MITNSTARWVVFLANVIGFVLALVLELAPAKIHGNALDIVLIFFIILFLIDAMCVVPVVWTAHT